VFLSVGAHGRHSEDCEHHRADQGAPLECVAAHGDLADGAVRETAFAGIRQDRDLIRRQAGEASGGAAPRLVLHAKVIVEVDSKREVLEGLNDLSRGVTWCREDEGAADGNRWAHQR
jgi:hypothetical protein